MTAGEIVSMGSDYLYSKSVEELHRLMEREETISDVLDTAYGFRGYGVYRSIRPLQRRSELLALLKQIDPAKIESVLEIGTAWGGTLYSWCRYFQNLSNGVSVDLPGGAFGGGYPETRKQLYEEFATDAELSFVRANSHSKDTFETVREALPNDGVDFVFIDGDHTYEGIKQDFEDYTSLLSTNGIVVLHDILGNPYDPDVQVDKFWEEISCKYDTTEVVINPNRNWGGFGIVRGINQ